MLRLNFHATLFEISAGQTFFSHGPDVARGPPIEEPCRISIVTLPMCKRVVQCDKTKTIIKNTPFIANSSLLSQLFHKAYVLQS